MLLTARSRLLQPGDHTQNNKFGPRYQSGRLLGYEEGSTKYRVLSDDDRKVKSTRDVVFSKQIPQSSKIVFKDNFTFLDNFVSKDNLEVEEDKSAPAAAQAPQRLPIVDLAPLRQLPEDPEHQNQQGYGGDQESDSGNSENQQTVLEDNYPISSGSSDSDSTDPFNLTNTEYQAYGNSSYAYTAHALAIFGVPTTYKQTLDCPDAKEWDQAQRAESGMGKV